MTLAAAFRLLLARGCAAALETDRRVSTVRGLVIPSYDGAKLVADVHIPWRNPFAKTKFPVIIFISSWAAFESEYFVDAADFAREGYLVLEYQARGFWFSGGHVEAAGPQDQRDISEVITYILSREHWRPDPDKIALAGISYGAGLSLLGAALDASRLLSP